MKKLSLLFLFTLIFCGIAYADDPVTPAPLQGITLKQGMVIDWRVKHTKNLTTFELASTKADPRFGNWNILWDGWKIDAGISYDASGMDSGAVLLGRDFGKLGNYLPIDFPLSKLVSITVYPIGIYVNDITTSPKASACSGGSFVKLSLTF
jgi:hypothetical protein